MKDFHLAGIIPVHKNDDSFGFQWPDCMMPIEENLVAIERSVMECAWAGCNTIWIVCNDDISPLIRHRIGEVVEDPVWLRALDPYPSLSRKSLPIYYVPIHPKHTDKLDSFGWSIIYGALTAFKVSDAISKWLIPQRYYVSFPYSIYDPEILRQYRKNISSKKGFFLSHEGKTIRDGLKLGFTFDKDDFVRYRRVVRKQGTKLFKRPEPGQIPKEKLPKQDRYSARFFTLEKIFGSSKVEEGLSVALPWYYPVDNWQEYAKFMASEHSGLIKRPNDLFLSYREWNPVGVDDE